MIYVTKLYIVVVILRELNIEKKLNYEIIYCFVFRNHKYLFKTFKLKSNARILVWF